MRAKTTVSRSSSSSSSMLLLPWLLLLLSALFLVGSASAQSEGEKNPCLLTGCCDPYMCPKPDKCPVGIPTCEYSGTTGGGSTGGDAAGEPLSEPYRDIDFSELNYEDYGEEGQNGTEASDSTGKIVSIQCADNKREFIATTEMILSGRSQLLSLLERKVLKGEFMNIYNTLTTTKCDLYHRKLNVISFLEQTNQSGETYSLEDMIETNVTLDQNESQLIENWFSTAGSGGKTRRTRRQLQEERDAEEDTSPPPTASPSYAPSASLPPVNETTAESSSTREQVAVTYQIVGTCRNCAVSNTGSFQLYDDAFRRALLASSSSNGGSGGSSSIIEIRTKFIQFRDLAEEDYEEDEDDKSDCVCSEGVEPTPQAPGVQECVDLMNERLPLVQQGVGVLQDLQLENLIELDQPEDQAEEGDEEDTNTTNTSSGKEEEEDEDEDADDEEEEDDEDIVISRTQAQSDNNPDIVNIWGRRLLHQLYSSSSSSLRGSKSS